jgi:SAM-dependent methyltransferase
MLTQGGEEILNVIQPEHSILDLGAGAGIVAQMNFKGLVEKVCGIDPDRRVAENPYLDEGKAGVGEAIPYPDASFDVVFADNVLEHLVEPGVVFSEIYRTLKSGGVFLMKTPNKWHYMPTIARLTPHAFHRLYNRMRGRNSEDTFPTQYRCNSARAIIRAGKAAGFSVRKMKLIEGRPEYLRLTAPTYALGWLYERLVNSTESFSALRACC